MPMEEMAPEEMEKWCKHYTEEYDSMVPPMWKAAHDDNVPAMKSLHYFYKKEVDGFGAANREDSTMPTHICCLRGHVEARASARAARKWSAVLTSGSSLKTTSLKFSFFFLELSTISS